MVEFKVVVGDPASGKSFPVTVEGQHANVLVRKKLGEEVDGMFLGLPGYKVQLTGGSDKDGFAMRPEIPQAGRKRILVSESIGFRPKDRGVRKKRTFRGNEISPEITQINCRIIERGPKPVEKLLGIEDDAAAEPEPEPEPEAEAEGETEAETDADAEPEAQPESDADAEEEEQAE